VGTPIRHPLVDAVTARVVRVDGRARVVRLSRPFAEVLARPVRGRRIVLVTDEGSRLTVGLRAALVQAGGAWVVTGADGALRDGLTGTPYADVDAAALPVEQQPAPSAQPRVAPAEGTTAQLTVDLTVLHRASHDTSLGGPVEALAAAVGDAVPTRWGESEPLQHRWDRWVLTQHARHAAPGTVRVVVEGDRLSATVTARVTEHGIEETTSLTVDVTVRDGPGADLDAAAERLTAALGELARTSLPTFALVVAREGEPDRSVRAVTYPPPNPLALLIGAPSVKRLGLEASGLDAERPVVVVGRPRLPGFVVPLGDSETSGWTALHRTLDAVGPERMSTLVAPPLLQAWEDDLHELDLLHEGEAQGEPGSAAPLPDAAAAEADAADAADAADEAADHDADEGGADRAS